MQHIFLDTNVILDFLSDRQPFSEFAAILFQMAKDKKIKLYVSAISFNNIYYILRKVTTHKKALKLISGIENLVEILDTNRKIIRQSINSNFKDFEDAIQYYSAVESGIIDVIATRDIKGFRNSDIPILSPESTVKIIMNQL